MKNIKMLDLVGKTVYSYITLGGDIRLRVWKITDVCNENGIIKVVVGDYKVFDLDLIGSYKWITSEWFTFERNDEVVRLILQFQWHNILENVLKVFIVHI